MVALELAVRRMKKNYDPADEDNVEEDADEKSDGRVMIQGKPPTNPPTALIVTLAHHHLTPRTIPPHYTHPALYTYATQTIHTQPASLYNYTPHTIHSRTPSPHTPALYTIPAYIHYTHPALYTCYCIH